MSAKVVSARTESIRDGDLKANTKAGSQVCVRGSFFLPYQNLPSSLWPGFIIKHSGGNPFFLQEKTIEAYVNGKIFSAAMGGIPCVRNYGQYLF